MKFKVGDKVSFVNDQDTMLLVENIDDINDIVTVVYMLKKKFTRIRTKSILLEEFNSNGRVKVVFTVPDNDRKIKK